MELFMAMFIFFMIVTAVFIAIAFLFPEWVGITGKAAKAIQQHQRGDVAAHTEPETVPEKKTE
ncbi:MAG: hypothetical protein K2P92_03745 [Bdellovibrionaceae bacterium]|nr:hypothetical protein [Pseudobdellovibrionaceae bacterium]